MLSDMYSVSAMFSTVCAGRKLRLIDHLARGEKPCGQDEKRRRDDLRVVINARADAIFDRAVRITKQRVETILKPTKEIP